MTEPLPPTSEPAPLDQVLHSILNPTPELIQTETAEVNRLLACRRCRKDNLGPVYCDQGEECENAHPLLPAASADASPDPESETSARRRGAPLGNTNAIKHGYYARKLREVEAGELHEFDFSGVREEALILRYFIRRLVEQSSAQNDLTQAESQLRVISHAVASLARILTTQEVLAESEDRRRRSSLQLNSRISDLLQQLRVLRQQNQDLAPDDPAW